MTNVLNFNYVIGLNFILVLILIELILIKNVKENFAFQAPYFRSETYQNMCEPKYGGLFRVKKELQDDCIKNLEGPPRQKIKCYYDEFMNQRCKYFF